MRVPCINHFRHFFESLITSGSVIILRYLLRLLTLGILHYNWNWYLIKLLWNQALIFLLISTFQFGRSWLKLLNTSGHIGIFPIPHKTMCIFGKFDRWWVDSNFAWSIFENGWALGRRSKDSKVFFDGDWVIRLYYLLVFWGTSTHLLCLRFIITQLR